VGFLVNGLMPLNNAVTPYQHSSCPVKPEVKQRLFIAIAYRPATKVLKLLEHLQKLAVEPATRLQVVAVANLHITLKILDMVAVADIASVHQVLDQQLSIAAVLILDSVTANDGT
jgi:hypothetical protein